MYMCMTMYTDVILFRSMSSSTVMISVLLEYQLYVSLYIKQLLRSLSLSLSLISYKFVVFGQTPVVCKFKISCLKTI